MTEIDGVRLTVVKLRVAWDPATQDHPAGWDWKEICECDTVLIDFEEMKDGGDTPPHKT